MKTYERQDITSARVLTVSALVVGSGAAGYNAALRLHKLGVTDVAIMTEGATMGTSRNAGSDKQTYYKMNLCSDFPDSPRAMAEDLFKGGCVDGDLCYVEAALSVKCFLQLAELGVGFPVNQLGEYVGYKTDHDPRQRATSAGPLTSKQMTECLKSAVIERNIKIHDGFRVVSIIKNGENAVGVLAFDKNTEDFVLVRCADIVWATGGPAGIYSDSVYPIGHTGCQSAPLKAGAHGANLTEWQYGLASVDPRWNVSGSYMQVLPRFVSVDSDGIEHDFLAEYEPNIGRALSLVFRKGYQWPFDCRRAADASSLIDLLVFRETALRGRRVYLDYTKNPFDLENLPYEKLDEEALTYLKSAGICFGKPIDRLRHMNEPAYQLYKSLNVDLETQKLEIALCAQHSNGGIAVDLWWQTHVRHLFAVGECAGTHGVYRPGGSALNAGQVGSTRAAQYISAHPGEIPDLEDFLSSAEKEYSLWQNIAEKITTDDTSLDNVSKLELKYSREMSAVGGAIRNTDGITEAIRHNTELYENFTEKVRVFGRKRILNAIILHNALITRIVYLTAMRDYVNAGGLSRGSAIYTDENGRSVEKMEEIFRHRLNKDENSPDRAEIRFTNWNNGSPESYSRPVHPLPDGGGFFENVWRRYREDKNIYGGIWDKENEEKQ